MRIILFLIVVFFISCNEQANSGNTRLLTYEDSLKTTILGNWGGLGETTPVWNIRKDSIYYYQRSAAYSYKIINQDMIIELPESKGSLRNIHVIEDTLFFLDEQGLEIAGYRFKNK